MIGITPNFHANTLTEVCIKPLLQDLQLDESVDLRVMQHPPGVVALQLTFLVLLSPSPQTFHGVTAIMVDLR